VCWPAREPSWFLLEHHTALYESVFHGKLCRRPRYKVRGSCHMRDAMFVADTRQARRSRWESVCVKVARTALLTVKWLTEAKDISGTIT
jgi:hypothetical protein